jgi:DNA segregation ATPase FtsK/SpoIIIE, S-DNA-T family
MIKTKRVRELETLIEHLIQTIGESKARAKAYFEHGRRYNLKLNDFFNPLLAETNNQLGVVLAQQPVSTLAGWNDSRWQTWDVNSAREETLIRIGDLVEPRTNGKFSVPAYIPFIGKGKTIIIKSGKSPELGLSLLQSLVIRTALMLPHQSRYTLLDPAGAGIAFPMRRYLPQVQENTSDVRRDLDQVMSGIQHTIETYLDTSITSFELVPQEIRINERFTFVFAADFPNQYDRRAIETLQQIANTGPVAGTYLFIHHNQNYELPRDMKMEDFKNAFYVDMGYSGSYTNLKLQLKTEASPPAELQTILFEKLRDAKPPERILDWDALVGVAETAWWQEQSIKIIQTPIGARGGADKLTLWFGVDDNNQPCAHGMLGAMTGSGKSNLYHVLISGLAVRYSPEELRFYLIDGKDGVEFQPYRHLPHAEVVSLRSSPELSRSVLAELIAEKERRNGMFTRAGVNDYPSYRLKGEPEGKLPRILLLVDEYQELFEGDKDGVASNYLLQLSQQGRSAGIHMLLASQRFGAAGMLNQTGIFGNLHLLMAMQMKASDVQALTEFGRRGKALIARCDLPGKIVVNDKGGDDNANLDGKVAYLNAARRNELLEKLQKKASLLPDDCLPRRVVFNGRSQPGLIDNPYLSGLLRRPAWPTAQELEKFARQGVETGGLGIIDWFTAERPRVAWLGQQFNVRGQAMLIFRRRVAENTLIIGGANTARYGMLAALTTCLALNNNPSETRFVTLDKSIPDSQWSGMLQLVHEAVLTSAGFSSHFSRDSRQLEESLDALVNELDKRRSLDEEDVMRTPSIFVILTELDRLEAIRRRADSYGDMADSLLGENLKRLYLEGPPLGIHLILSFASVRAMSNVIDERRGLVNFQHRVALQMSEDESHTFTRNRKASQLQIEGLTPICALYMNMENDNSIRFKPYSSDAAGGAQNESLADQLCMIGAELAQRRLA